MQPTLPGVTTGHGGRESRTEGEGGQVIGHSKTGRYAKCRAPKRYWVSSVNAAGAACRCNELYRQMFNPELYLLAYGRIYSNQGAMTPGVSTETVDGMSLGKIGRIIECDAPRALSVQSGQEGPDSRKRTGSSGRSACRLVGQTGRRGGASAVGGVLRASVLRPVPRFPSRARLPYRAAEVANTWTGTTWFDRG